jgi:hypothetical protein
MPQVTEQFLTNVRDLLDVFAENYVEDDGDVQLIDAIDDELRALDA